MDYRTTEEVEQSRCIRPRQRWKRCPCGKQPGKECSPDPNGRVKRIYETLAYGRKPRVGRASASLQQAAE